MKKSIGLGWILLLALLGGALQSLLMWRLPGSDSDFAGLCCFAESLSRGINPTNPYFPGYPALLWLGVKLGLSCLKTAALLNGLGCALAVYNLGALWRRFGLSTVAALLGAALLLLLPDMIWTFQAPHTDPLMLGLLALYVHAAVACWRGEAQPGLLAGGGLAGCVIALTRWHLALILLPVALVLLLTRATRRQALGLALPVFVAMATAYLLLFAAYGSLSTSARLQIFTGLAATADTPATALNELTEDYAAFADAHRQQSVIESVGLSRIVRHTAGNFSRYLTVRATLAGLLLFLLAGLAWRAWPRGAGWLLALCLGYSLAVSPTYFVYRASCIVEWCGLVLLGAALAVMAQKLRPAVWRALALCAIVLVALYAVPRASLSCRQAVANRRGPLINVVHQLADDPRQVVGFNDYNWCPGNPPWNLPAASLNRLWVDDPLLDRLTGSYPRYHLAQLRSGEVRPQLLVINQREQWRAIAEARAWAAGAGYVSLAAPPGYELWLDPARAEAGQDIEQ